MIKEIIILNNEANRMFNIIKKDWYKRRQLTGKETKPIHVDIPDYQAKHNHFCDMIVQYSDGSSKHLIGRVIYNRLTHEWTVDGMEVAVKVTKPLNSV